VSQHHKAIAAHQQQLLAAVAELDRRKAWRIDGATSMVAWLVQRCSVTASTAREWVTAAPRLEALPEISNAMAQGKLSFDQIKPLVEVAKPETDARLAEEATRWSAKQVRELANANRSPADGDAANAYGRRYFRFNDRRCTVSGYFPSDQYAKIKGTYNALARRHGGFDGRTYDQRLADVMVEICEPTSGVMNGCEAKVGPKSGSESVDSASAGSKVSAESPAHTRTRPTVVVHADLTYLAGSIGEAELDVLGPLAPEVARRLACDAKIILSADDAAGHSIQQGGARRSPTPAQRIEIRRRDKGCRFPGCTYTDYTDVHHVVHWSNGGRTDISNLVTLCDQHHRAVHELGWKMWGNANELLTFQSPTGRILTSTPSPTFKPMRAGLPG